MLSTLHLTTIACSVSSGNSSTSDTGSPFEAEILTPCETPDGAPSEINSFEDVANLINLLPKPVTLVCFLEAIPRPLEISATASQQSVQPANGRENPRIFLFSNSLVMAFATFGKDHDTNALELSQMTGPVSVKGEVSFPVMTDITATDIYQSIRLISGGPGTRCAQCHGQENPAPSPFPANTFTTNIRKPPSGLDVSIEALNDELELCGDSQDERCRRIRAALSHGDIWSRIFSN